jgi:hypothetical protein
MVERFGGVARALARVTAGIESASPLPRVSVKRVADASCDRADANIAATDVPAIWPFGVPGVGEGRHAAVKRGLSRNALLSGPVVSRGAQPTEEGRGEGLPGPLTYLGPLGRQREPNA